MGNLSIRLAACFVLALAAAGSAICAEEGEEQDEKVPLDQVPAAVKDAAVKAVNGLVLTEAEKEEKNGVVVYELEGTANGKEYEVKVDANGEVLSAEVDDEDNDEATAGDDDDDDQATAGDDDDDDEASAGDDDDYDEATAGDDDDDDGATAGDDDGDDDD